MEFLAKTGNKQNVLWCTIAYTRGHFVLVGVAGFEPTASSSRTKRATKLRHTPMYGFTNHIMITLIGDFRKSVLSACGRDHTETMSRTIASGAQNVLIGVKGEVPMPAETLTSMLSCATTVPLRFTTCGSSK